MTDAPQIEGLGDEVVVKTLKGMSISVRLPGSCAATTVDELKTLVQDSQGIPHSHLHLVHAGRVLTGHATLDTYGVTPGNTIHLVLRLRRDPVLLAPPCPSGATTETEAVVKFMMKEWPAVVQATRKADGIHLWGEPSTDSPSFLTIIEGPPDSPYQGGKFLVEIGIDVKERRMRVRTPLFHPTVTSSGQVFLFDGFEFSSSCDVWPSSGTLLEALQCLRTQLLWSHFDRFKEGVISEHHLGRSRFLEWKNDDTQAQRNARVATILFGFTKSDRQSSEKAWMSHLIRNCPQLRREVECLLMAAGKDPRSGNPRYDTAFLVARLPSELLDLIIRKLVHAHVPDEQDKMKNQLVDETAQSYFQLVPDNWKQEVL